MSLAACVAPKPPHQCLYRLLAAQAERLPEAPAILAPGRAPLTYGRLHQHVNDAGQTLRAMGIGRTDRVALVLPNGAEMVVAFLTLTVRSACILLNPAYSAKEFEAYLAALQATVLVVQADMASPARDVARRCGLRLIELCPLHEAAAGLFTCMGETVAVPLSSGYASPDDVALVLHTTGTTARPKIVPLTHSHLWASARFIQAALELVPSDRCLNVMPLFHGHSLKGMVLPSLLAGASVLCTPGFSPSTFFANMAAYGPTWFSAVPTMHQAILAQAAAYGEIIAACPLRFIRSTSAFLPPQVLEGLERVFQVPVIEAYGTAETSMVTCNPLPPRPRKRGSGGVAVGQEVAIMNDAGVLLPAGEVGEIVARGAAVMQAYENDPVATREAFTQGWFRTGDQGYLDAEGYLFVTGRIKEFINRGGQKIAPPEVEQVLMDHPAVAQAVTFALPHPRLGEDIAAAVVLHPHAGVTADDIRQFVVTRLAAFKVPQQILLVDDIPKGPTGKIQRLGLAAALGLTALVETAAARSIDPLLSPSPVEEVLLGLWRQLLGVDRLRSADNFFQVGGDSLLATQLLSRVRDVLHVELSFDDFFQTPTVTGMARCIEAATRVTPESSLLPLQPVSRDGPLPLSYAQQRLWFLEQLGLSGQAYTLLEVVRMQGTLHTAALEQSLRAITTRHEIFRTTFADADGQPYQMVQPAVSVPLPTVDLHTLAVDEQQRQVRRLARQEAQRLFDLAHGPLLRTRLLRLGAEDHVLILTLHHLVSDGWSHGVFWREMALLYESFASGKPLALPPLPIQYADFAHWQLQGMQAEALEALLSYWQQQLADAATLQMPTDRPRPATWTARGARHSFTIPPALTQALKRLSQQYGVTLFMTLLAALQTLLHRYTAQDDIVVGTLIANRNRSEIEGLIGFFVNTLVLRTDLSGNPRFDELLGRVREVTLGAYSHQNLPFEKLLEALRPPRDLSRNPLFQVLFVLHNTPRHIPTLSGLSLRALEVDTGTAKFDLMLSLSETQEGLRGWFEYSTDLFAAATITRMAGHFQTLLQGIIAAPEQRLATLPLLTEDEHEQVRVRGKATRVAVPTDACLHEMFAQQVARTPEAVALVHAESYLTYDELNRRANQVAHYLRRLGVGPEVLVGLSVERSFDMVVGLLGILKAGGAYVPLDPTYPRQRLAFMLEDAQLSVLVTQEHLLERFPAHKAEVVCLDTAWQGIAAQRDQEPVSGATPDNLASVLYTSGSTGLPKGVLGTHRASLNVLAWLWQAYPFTSQEVCCQKTSLSFVDSVQELLAPLLCGVRTVLVPEAVLQDPERLVQTLATHHVTRILLVPSLLWVLLETNVDLGDQLPHLRLWFVSGECLRKELWQRFKERMPQCRLINLYGTSEVSANATWYDTELMHEDLVRVPIGHPIANTSVYVLDRHQHPVPIGVPGELYVGGASLARGYLNRPALSAEKFCSYGASDEPETRLYKTGDRVRFLPDGALEFLGRLDHQVKVRGYRIELGEIEAALGQHPAIAQAVVLAQQDGAGDTRLVAYVVVQQTPAPTTSTLHRFLKTILPEYMIPATYVQLDTMPLLPNGKVDRQALPAPSHIRPALQEAFVAPRTPDEEVLAGIWATLLGLEHVGVHDNFFEVGGHSLLAVQVVSRLRKALHIEVPLRALFDTPTVARLAAHIDTMRQAGQGVLAPPIVPVARQGDLPASMTQEQIWTFEQFLPGTPLFNISYALCLSGVCNVMALEQSINDMVQRHEILRTTFASVAGGLVQRVAAVLSLPLPREDLTPLPASDKQEEVLRLASQEARQPFDLVQGPLLRFRLLRLDEQEHVLLVTLHHIVSDGWSLGLLVHELAVLYEARSTSSPSSLPALPLQYADFVHWQHQWQHSDAREAQLTYWKQQLQGPLPVLELPTDRPRTTALSFQTARQHLELSGELSEALVRLSRHEASTLFMTLLAAFKMLLYTYTGQEDLRVCTLVANRSRQEIEGVFGLFINTLLLRTSLGGNPTLREVLRRVRETTLGAYTHQDLPLEDLVQTLEREQGLKRTALSQVMFVLQPAWPQPVQLSALTLSVLETDSRLSAPAWTATTFEVILMLRERPQGLVGTCIYKTALFDPVTIRRLLTDYQRVLEHFVVQPEQPLAGLETLRSSWN